MFRLKRSLLRFRYAQMKRITFSSVNSETVNSEMLRKYMMSAKQTWAGHLRIRGETSHCLFNRKRKVTNTVLVLSLLFILKMSPSVGNKRTMFILNFSSSFFQRWLFLHKFAMRFIHSSTVFVFSYKTCKYYVKIFPLCKVKFFSENRRSQKGQSYAALYLNQS